jgi:hypothetical protein
LISARLEKNHPPGRDFARWEAKIQVLRASNGSWKGDRYHQFEGKFRFFRQVFIQKPKFPMTSHESGLIIAREGFDGGSGEHMSVLWEFCELNFVRNEFHSRSAAGTILDKIFLRRFFFDYKSLPQRCGNDFGEVYLRRYFFDHKSSPQRCGHCSLQASKHIRVMWIFDW